MGDDGARRCDNCGVIRESFMCAPCLRQAVSDHASRVRAARARTRSAAAQCYPVLQARQALVVHDRGLQHLRSLMRQQVLAIQKRTLLRTWSVCCLLINAVAQSRRSTEEERRTFANDSTNLVLRADR